MKKTFVSLITIALTLIFAGGYAYGKNVQKQEPAPVPPAEAKKNMEKVCKFLKDAKVYYIATVEGDQPRVRPFGTVNIYKGRLYIQTGKKKNVFKQIMQNPKVEICSFHKNAWIRLSGTLVPDNDVNAKRAMLDAYPSLKKLYKAEDENTQVLYFRNGTATISSYAKPNAPVTLQF